MIKLPVQGHTKRKSRNIPLLSQGGIIEESHNGDYRLYLPRYLDSRWAWSVYKVLAIFVSRADCNLHLHVVLI